MRSALTPAEQLPHTSGPSDISDRSDSSDIAVSPGVLRKGLHIVYRAVTAITGPWTRHNMLTWLGLLLLVLTIRWLLFEPYKIPSESMEPTLHGDPRFFRGDRVGVNKLIYGPRVPFMNKRIFHLAAPKRWDIVVFKTVDPKSEHGTLIKRVVGLPGERIHIQDGTIRVNGAPVEPPEAIRDILYYTSRLGRSENDVRRFAVAIARQGLHPEVLNPVNFTVRDLYAQLDDIRDRLGDRDPGALTPDEMQDLTRGLSAVSMGILEKLFTMQQDAQYPLRYGIFPDDAYSLVPENCYLVCGDNSPDSADGRVFGWLPNDHILGRAFCIWWPLSRRRDFTGFAKTWWGMGLIYGIPAFIIAYEGLAWWYQRRQRARDSGR